MNVKLLKLALICFYFIGLPAFNAGTSAQDFIKKQNHFSKENSTRPQTDKLKILAVMVNFQEDNDATTYGNGKFASIYSKDYGSSILDPLPHDKTYFESHLTFAKNYFEKVSNGKLNIEFTVLPDTFSVSKTMRNYSPSPGSDDLTSVAQFAQEVWTKADQINPGFSFSDYDLFLVFHAGAGRDITLPGSIGNERDLPSVYLGEKTLENIFGTSFNGFPVSNGSFNIKNSMIIPETENRELESLSGKILFEITINGLIVANIASHLGLPDLFNTETGSSAIGRFGLMDGQSIFAYNGCFPPEPSAWEKIYLGWAEPIEISSGEFNISLAAKLAATLSDTVILKLPLNSTEYYLIENRQRDVFKDGSKINYISNGSVLTKTFLKDTTGFYSYDIDSLSGVIMDVDEYDWALPGNGIVIWHIDENVINSMISINKINNNKTQRGVDVEEADGIQDIGESFTTIFGDEVIGEGSAEDFWYKGNKAKLYKNIFSKDTRPDTKTNKGANSLITVKDFSAIANKMSFKVVFGDSIIKPIFSNTFENISANYLSVIDEGDIPKFAFVDDGDLYISDGVLIENSFIDFSDFKVASLKNNDKTYLFGCSSDKINYLVENGTTLEQGSFQIQHQISSAPVIRKNLNNKYDLIFGTLDGIIFVYDLESIATGNPLRRDSILVGSEFMVSKISASADVISAIANSNMLTIDFTPLPSVFFSTDGSKIIFTSDYLKDIVSSVDKDGLTYSVILTGKNKIFVLSDNLQKFSFDLLDNNPVSSISLADIKHNGENYILINSGSILKAYNFAGALAENFPVLQNLNQDLYASPLAADIEGDSKSELITTDAQGNIFAFDGGSGKLVDGFPISFGKQLTSQPVLYNYKGKTAIAGFDASGKFSAWTISSIYTKPDWAEANGNKQNTSFIPSASNTNSTNEFFPVSRAYNYPNPVYDGSTAIRYFVGEDSRINIKIFDIAGDFVAELNDDAQGGFDNETIWNVNDIQSGVYLARIEANGSSGKSESVIIKIAVVK